MKKNDIQKLKEQQELLETESLKRKFHEKKEESTYKKLLKEVARENEILQQQVKIVKNLQALEADEIKIKPEKPTSSESTVITQYSDIHIEEEVMPEKVNNLNEYTPDIGKARNEKYWQRVVRLTDIHRSGTEIDKIIVQLGGDTISGYIHEENLENNFMSPIEAIMLSYNMISAGINYLLQYGNFKHIHVICNYGNHGRTTLKRRISTGAENNHEFLMYNFLANSYEGNKRVSFQIGRGYHIYATVYDLALRFHHGDNVNYLGGVGGITIPIKKAISQWNKARRADIDYFGHFHQLTFHKDFVCNGSMIGWNPYAVSIKADFERPQLSWSLINRKYGKTAQHPIIVD